MGPELTNEENRDSLIQFENVETIFANEKRNNLLNCKNLFSFSTSIQPKVARCSDEISEILNW